MRGVALAVALSLALGPVAAHAQQPAPPPATPPAVGTAPIPSSSEPPREPTPEELAEAKHSFESGLRFYNAGNYEAARAQFEAAHKLSRFPSLLYNLGRTAEKQNQRREAIVYYEQYLATNPPDAPDIALKLSALRKAEKGPEDAAQAATPSQTESTAAAPSKWLLGTQKLPPIPALALTGTGAAFLIIGIGCGAGALSASRQIEAANGQMYRGANADAAARGATLNRAAIAFDVLGALALAGGGAWIGYWFYLKTKKPESLPLALRVSPGPGSLAIVGSY